MNLKTVSKSFWPLVVLFTFRTAITQYLTLSITHVWIPLQTDPSFRFKLTPYSGKLTPPLSWHIPGNWPLLFLLSLTFGDCIIKSPPMANTPKNMNLVKQILLLHKSEVPKKDIARQLGISKNTVKSYLVKASLCSESIDELVAMDTWKLPRIWIVWNHRFRPFQ